MTLSYGFDSKGGAMHFVGLTDYPAQRRIAHGNPPDWRHIGPFPSEAAARRWEKEVLGKPGREGGLGGAGWRYGYWYTITGSTVE
jgi:hypothetical protein